jgi:hypothetical protein
MTQVVLGYEVDRPAIEPDEDNGVQGDPLTETIYDHYGKGWHLAPGHPWHPPAELSRHE